MLLATVAGNPVAGFLSSTFVLGFFAFLVAAAVWFFRGPAKAAENYANGLAMSFQNPQQAALFRQIYATKGPKSTTVAWLLSVFLSPSISYVYQGKWALAVISFVTLQGLFVWYVVAIFTMPFEVVAANKKLADEAFQQVSLSSGLGAAQPSQQIIIHQQAYMPPPYGATAPGTPQPEQPSAQQAAPQTQTASGPAQPFAPNAHVIPQPPISGPPASLD